MKSPPPSESRSNGWLSVPPRSRCSRAPIQPPRMFCPWSVRDTTEDLALSRHPVASGDAYQATGRAFGSAHQQTGLPRHLVDR